MSDWFAAFALCAMLVYGQYETNDASRRAADCTSEQVEILGAKIDHLQLAVEKGAFRNAQTTETDESAAYEKAMTNQNRAFSALLSGAEKRAVGCQKMDDYKDRTVLFSAIIAAFLAFMGRRSTFGSQLDEVTKRRRKIKRPPQ